MSKRTTIYVLFKEFPDPNGRVKSAPYIQDSIDYLAHQNALVSDWSEVAEVLEFFCYEAANWFYDEENLTGLLYVADMFPSEYPSVSVTIRSTIQTIGLTSWRANPENKTQTYHWGQYNITDDLLGDMAQREVNHDATSLRISQDTAHLLLPKDKEYEPCVLLQFGAITAPQGEIRVTMDGGRSIKLQSVDSIRGMHRWLSSNRFPKRQYSFSPKHGDKNHEAGVYSNRHRSNIPAAQLLTTKVETEELLNLAVGNSVQGDLWYYDRANSCYIYFENQGATPQCEFHAYHLHPGDKNYGKIDLKKISEVV